MDPIASDSLIKNEQKSYIETTELTPKIETQPETKEYDKSYSDVNTESVDDAIPEGYDSNTEIMVNWRAEKK